VGEDTQVSNKGRIKSELMELYLANAGRPQ